MFQSVNSSFIKSSTAPETAEKQAGLIDSIYLTVGDPAGWRSLLRDLVAATASRSARLLVMNDRADRVISSLKINIDDHYHRQYTDHFVNKCPWRPELRRMAPGRLYSTYLHFSCPQPDFYRTEFFNDWARHQDIHHGICGTIYCDAKQTVQLLIQRTRDQGHYTEADTAFVNCLVPHMQHSFLLAGKIAHTRARAEAIAIAAGCEALPFLVLDKALHVTYCTPEAERLVTGNCMLQVKKGKLLITDELQDRRLNRLLRECVSAADTRMLQTGGGRLAVPRLEGSDLQLLVRPLHPEIPLLLGEPGVYAAVYIYDPAAMIKIDPVRLRELYSMTGAEARVAVAMTATPDSAEIARQCAISLHTLRSHIKSIFSKTQTHNRAELMKRLLTSPVRVR
ncbi:MAG: helix-turn-helix transcriptional regulator [Desulfobacterales bacterium]